MKKGGVVVLIIFLLVFSNISFSLASSQYNLTYDGNGNLITGDGKYREYNEFNQLIRVYNGTTNSSNNILETYVYDASGDRILAKYENYGGSNTPDGAVVYANDNFERQYANLQGTPKVNDTSYVSDENGIVGHITKNVSYMGNDYNLLQKLYYSNDHLGSTSVITNDSGGIVEQTFYDPYGQILSGGLVSRYDYQGREFSQATGDYDFRFRKYNPELGLFTQPEQAFPNIYDPQQLNRYSFERRNPYKYVDPTGKFIETAIDVGFISYDISQLSSSEGRGSWVNWASLGADVASAIIPFATGGGALIRGGEKIISGGKVATKLTSNEIGRIGERKLLTKFGGESQKSFDTSLGRRIFDQFSVQTSIARESKVGYQTLTSSNKLQIDKTAELLSSGRIDNAENYFFTSPVTGKGGASKNLLNYAEKQGITNIQKTANTATNIFNKIKSIFGKMF